jgi:septum formation protein
VTLVLASSSAIRRAMLEAAGIQFEVAAAGIDEDALKNLFEENEPPEIAMVLAANKAVAVSRKRGADWVVGCDSLASVNGRRFDKPRGRDEAAEHLRLFSGNEMRLTSAVALARGGSPQWTHSETAILKVRKLSEDFIQSYLSQEWPAVSHCVGVFRIEGPGVQLFESIEGDHFTILGMPLLPLLSALRERRLLAA